MMPSEIIAECWSRPGGDVFVLIRVQVLSSIC